VAAQSAKRSKQFLQAMKPKRKARHDPEKGPETGFEGCDSHKLFKISQRRLAGRDAPLQQVDVDIRETVSALAGSKKKRSTAMKLGLGFVLAASCFGASWTGQISDSACGASHAKMLSAHSNLKTDRDCTLACIKGGSKYVFVTGGQVYQIDNQSFADLEKRAGETVQVTGDMKGNTITVSKISTAK
jgi:hypothetical protein